MSKFVLLVLCAGFTSSYSELSYRKALQKCSIKDNDCLKDMTERVMQYVGEFGIPEMNIPPHDPYQIKDQTVSVVGLMDVTMVDGVVEGMKDCTLESFYTNIEEGITYFDTLCNVFTIKGVYRVRSSPLIDQVFGNIVSGEGNGSIVMDKLKMSFITPYEVKMKNGEFFIIPDTMNGNYTYEMEKVTFAADQISFGILEIAPAVTSFLNRHWENIMRSFGRFFSDKGYSLGHDNIKTFFGSIPAKEYLTDDLSPYVKIEDTKRFYPKPMNSVFKYSNCTGLCSVSDGECQKQFWLNLVLKNAGKGNPEQDIPPLYPFGLNDVSLKFFDLLNITLIKGEALGINGTNCAIPVYEIDVDNMTMHVEIICQSIIIEGIYEIRSHPIFCFILHDVNGYGKGRIELEVVRYAYTCPFKFTEEDDGEIYFEPNFSEAEWFSEVQKNATIYANNIRFGDRDVTECIVRFINQYWRIIFSDFAYWFHKTSMDYFFEIWQRVYSIVPTSSYICDLTL